MRALVIDDSRAMRMILGSMLTDLGFEVDSAGDGRAGLESLEGGSSPDLILVDWNMPVLSGIDFVEAVRLPPYDNKSRIVMVTTETEVPQVVRALEAGADEYLMKPFTREALTDKLTMLGLVSP